MNNNYKMVGGSNRKIEYGLSITLIVLTVFYLAIFSGLCQKLTAGCVKIDSTLGKIRNRRHRSYYWYDDCISFYIFKTNVM